MSQDEQLPDIAGFSADGGCLDAQCAWEHFGGLSIDEAYRKFCENPLAYQEDFMFMGAPAFAYYFPVIERYITQSHVDVERQVDVEAMWILAHCIKNQIGPPCSEHVQQLKPAITALIRHVRLNPAQYSINLEEQQYVDSAWAELEHAN